MLHRLLQPPIAEAFQHAPDAHRAADRVAVIGVEGEREIIPTSRRTARALAICPGMSMSGRVQSFSKRIFTAAGLSFSRASTTRSTPSTLRSPLPPIEA